MSDTEDPQRQFHDDVISVRYILSDASAAGIYSTGPLCIVHRNNWGMWGHIYVPKYGILADTVWISAGA
jgi:hypothetical protein